MGATTINQKSIGQMTIVRKARGLDILGRIETKGHIHTLFSSEPRNTY
jgi:hypothetical protein